MRAYVAKINELPPGTQKSVRVGRQSVLVIHDKESFYALRNLCTHESVALEGGLVVDGKIVCAAHGATFDLKTGQATAPAFKAVRLYKVILEGDSIFVDEL